MPYGRLETRCCNLKTLDAVQGCAFGCSYCAVQSFYHQGEIRFVDNLAQRLSDIDLSEDIWHIGTGQSSDSLLWGNDYGTLDALKILARRYPEKIIELKTKSARTDWISEDWPRNIIATWSLNAEVIQRKEEHLTATIPSASRRREKRRTSTSSSDFTSIRWSGSKDTRRRTESSSGPSSECSPRRKSFSSRWVR